MSNLGPVKQFFGIQISHHKQSLLLSQSNYISEVLNKAGMLHSVDLQLQAFADSDWAANHSDRRSISGICVIIGSNLLSWCVKKQTIVARSSTEAEYCSLAVAAADVLWLCRLLADFHIPSSSPTPIHCDNVSALALSNNPVFHARTKHIEVDYPFIRDCIQTQHATIHHISTTD
ncbi:uncharacterized protein LOC110104240 [Dendrobium catenatum]|uniref:uncharacterized protein LOC110104240 n=1 Tax=Dendrobium catenatum TaxID=906689 RepID=UPI0010A08F6F|nr:uncharacterized protein LOC110104240 [Dendrobium catenatum]